MTRLLGEAFGPEGAGPCGAEPGGAGPDEAADRAATARAGEASFPAAGTACRAAATETVGAASPITPRLASTSWAMLSRSMPVSFCTIVPATLTSTPIGPPINALAAIDPMTRSGSGMMSPVIAR